MEARHLLRGILARRNQSPERQVEQARWQNQTAHSLAAPLVQTWSLWARVNFGGQTLAAGQEITQIEGAPPNRRVVIVKWNSLEQLHAWRNSEQYKEDRKIGDKYAKTIRAFAVEGLPQN